MVKNLNKNFFVENLNSLLILKCGYLFVNLSKCIYFVL